MVKIVALDIETDGFDATRIWVACARDIHTGEEYVFTNLTTIDEERERFIEFCSTCDVFVMHNGIQFDQPVIKKLVGDVIDPRKIIDTLVLSRLVDYNIEGGHSLDAWGKRLNNYKGSYNDWSKLTQEMIDYCRQDVIVTSLVYKQLFKVFKDLFMNRSVILEHQIQILCQEMHENGFYFDKEKAEQYLDEINQTMKELEDEFQECFPPVLVEERRIKYRKKRDGTLYSNVERAMDTYPKYSIKDGEELLLYDYKIFKPGSSKDRIERLWESGWKPIDKTKGHIAKEREGTVDERTKYYGWMCNETNLNTLPNDAPKGAHNLARWLTLEGRRSSLVEWLGCVASDGRIHGRFQHIGAWTGRMAHSKPNQANIPAAFHGTADTAVKKIKESYDGKLRALWTVPEGCYLVGTDAEGIQLRILAHLMKSESYRDAILNGRKEDQTDIHNLNRKALGMDHVTRDMAKTFIYAFLLGAGTGKIAQILNTTTTKANEAIENFLKSIDGLEKLKKEIIPYIAERGYFKGLDGRKVLVPNQHKTLAGMLQNGESVIMKLAATKWVRESKEKGLDFKLVTWPHDEWQTEIKGSLDDAEELGNIQRNAIVEAGVELGLFCPLAGSTDIGKDWAETH